MRIKTKNVEHLKGILENNKEYETVQDSTYRVMVKNEQGAFYWIPENYYDVIEVVIPKKKVKSRKKKKIIAKERKVEILSDEYSE